MEVVDPFVPSFRPDDTGFGEIPQEWATPFTPEQDAAPVSPIPSEESPAEEHSAGEPAPAAPVTNTEPATAWTPAPQPAFQGDGGAVAQAKGLAEKLSGTLRELQQTLEQTTEERTGFLRERAEMQERIRALEAEAARKEEFKALLQTGMGSTLSTEDLQSLQSMTDALTQDPDRLTLLFNVVQQAPKLATAITVYGQLRRLADQS